MVHQWKRGKVTVSDFNKEENNAKKIYAKIFPFAFILILLFIILFFFRNFPTGRAVLDISPEYASGEQIKGNIHIVLSNGELLPSDTTVRVKLNEQSNELLLSGLISEVQTEGNYYIIGKQLNSSGFGYGIRGNNTDGNETLILSLQLEKFNLAAENGELKVSFIFDNEIIFEINKEVITKVNADVQGFAIKSEPTFGIKLISLSTCNLTLNEPNDVYELTGNVNSSATCFNVIANNVTIDCKGFIINYSGTSAGYGINSSGYNYTTARNCIIKQTNTGVFPNTDAIFILSANTANITNNTIHTGGNTANGVTLSSTTNSTVRGNLLVLNGTTSFAFNLGTSHNNSIINNTVLFWSDTSSTRGVFLSSSLQNNISYNVIWFNNNSLANGFGIIVAGASASNIFSYNNITGRAIDSAYVFNIYVSNSYYNLFSNNTVFNAGGSAPTILLNNASHTLFVNNTILSNDSNAHGFFLNSTSNNITLLQNTINTSGRNASAFYIGDSINNSVFKQNTVIESGGDIFLFNGSSSGYINITNNTLILARALDLNLSSAVNFSYLIDQPIRNYTFFPSGIFVNIKDSVFGEIKFIVTINGSGANLSADILISNNSAFINATVAVSGLNRSANITLYGIGSRGFLNFSIIRDNTVCNASTSPRCYNFTALNVTDVSFNVTSGGNYTINGTAGGSDTTFPIIDFVAPTRANESNVTSNWVFMNVTVTEANEANITFRIHNTTAAINVTTFTNTGNRTLNVTGLADGNYTYNVSVVDTSNNRNTTETRTIRIDTINPGVTINAPSNTTYAVANQTFNVMLNEPGVCNYTLNNGLTNITMQSNNNVNFNATNSSLGNLQYTFRAYCFDNVGNANRSSNILFVVNVPTDSGSSGGSSGVGAGGGSSSSVTQKPKTTVKTGCEENWQCGQWTACAAGRQIRDCVDANSCSTYANEPDKEFLCQSPEFLIDKSPNLDEIKIKNGSEGVFSIDAEDASLLASSVELKIEWKVDGILIKTDNGIGKYYSTFSYLFNRDAIVTVLISTIYRTEKVSWNIKVVDSDCNEKWACEWTKCFGGFNTPVNCKDLNKCDTQGFHPVKQQCVCEANFFCEEWGECESKYDITTLVREESVEREQKRICRDTFKCFTDRIETRTCEEEKKEVTVSKKSDEKGSYVEIADKSTEEVFATLRTFIENGVRKVFFKLNFN